MSEEQKQDWYFTFGFGHEYPNGYTVINGTYYEAREEMIRRFGRKWAMQYESAEEAGVEKYGLKKIN